MKAATYDYDVRINYGAGFETLLTKGRDAAEAAINALRIVRRKQGRTSCYRTVTSVTVIRASHEAYGDCPDGKPLTDIL